MQRYLSKISGPLLDEFHLIEDACSLKNYPMKKAESVDIRKRDCSKRTNGTLEQMEHSLQCPNEQTHSGILRLDDVSNN
jgi:hypothetical protein